MDERIREHARTLVDWSARVEPGDDVVVAVDHGAHDLAVAVARELGERGATLLTTYDADEVDRAYLQAHDGDFGPHAHERALFEAGDVYLRLSGTTNTAAEADVPGDQKSAHRRAREGVREAQMETDWVSTLHPTRALAQQAGMSFETYREFVYGAILRDWESLAEEMGRLKDLLDDGSEVRVVSDGTDLTLSIENRIAVNSAASVDYDSHNLPSGEVFTAPADVEGTVTFDVPMTVRGTRLRNVRLTFEDGVVVDHAAEVGEETIAELLATDDGARQLGELGIGMNRGIDRVTDNILFDEKMGGTVHMALGRAYRSNYPEGHRDEVVDSAIHTDLITDMGEGSRMEIDGEVVQRDGAFRWEDGFEG